MPIKALLFVTLLIPVGLLGQWFGMKRGKTGAEETFTDLIGDRALANGKIEGGALNWQGYSAFLKFKPSDAFQQFLKSRGVKLVTREEYQEIPPIIGNETTTFERFIETVMTLPPDAPDSFPGVEAYWKTSEVESPVVYSRDGFKNDWSHDCEEFFLYDPKENIIYFTGKGA